MSKASDERRRMTRLGEQLRGLAMSAYVYHNESNRCQHDTPGWPDDWSVKAWMRIATRLLEAGWTPPPEPVEPPRIKAGSVEDVADLEVPPLFAGETETTDDEQPDQERAGADAGSAGVATSEVDRGARPAPTSPAGDVPDPPQPPAVPRGQPSPPPGQPAAGKRRGRKKQDVVTEDDGPGLFGGMA